MKLCCSTLAAKAWLTAAVRYIPSEWTGMNLFVVDFDKIPMPHKILGLFKTNGLNEAQILRMLSSMNMGVDTSRWNVLSMKSTDKGTHVVFDIDDEQYAVLSGRNFSLFFGAGTALFKDLSKKRNGAKAQPDEMDLSLSDLDLHDEDDDQIEVTIEPSAESETKTATAQDPLPVIEPNIPTTAAHGEQNASGAASQGNTNAENDALANIIDAAAQAPGAQV